MKKIKFTLFIIFSVLVTSHAYSDVIFDGDITLSTQAEVDTFAYTEITGILTISGNDINNLNGLSALTRVRSLRIAGNGSLTNVDGLSALIHVGLANPSLSTFIEISGNPVLTNLDGLSSLTAITGRLIINDNALLETVNGFSSVTEVQYELRITNNPQLTSLNGFTGITTIAGPFGTALVIGNNDALTNIDGLSSLQSIYGKTASVSITSNDALSDIDGLSSLSSLSVFGNTIDISHNPVLKNINGLASLTVFSYGYGVSSISINNNALLEDLDGLSNLRGQFGGGFNSEALRIEVTNNVSLIRCSGLFQLLVSLGWERVTELIALGNIEVAENGAGCTIEDIIQSGQSVSIFSVINKQTGTQVYQFYNDAVTLDLADPEFSNWAIEAHTFPSQVGRVEFKIDNKFKRTDKVSPYTFVPHHLDKIGTYVVTATVYSNANNKKGEQGVQKTATIHVVNSAANDLLANNQEAPPDPADELSIYPVPVQDQLFVKISGKAGKDALLTISSIQGNLVYKGTYSAQESEPSGINTLSFQPGVYVLQIFGKNGFHSASRFIKK